MARQRCSGRLHCRGLPVIVPHRCLIVHPQDPVFATFVSLTYVLFLSHIHRRSWNRRMNRRPEASALVLVWFLCVLIFTSIGFEGDAIPQEGWRFGADIGPFFKTFDGTVMGLGVNADYFFTEEFSVGPAVQFLPFGDLTQFQMAAVARYHVRTNFDVNLVPFAGIGFAHASGTGKLSSSGASDSSVLIQNGVSLEYQINNKLALALTGMINFYNLDFAPNFGDRKSGALLFGVRYQYQRRR